MSHLTPMAPPAPTGPPSAPPRWPGRLPASIATPLVLGLLPALLVGIVVRALLLPVLGLMPDLDGFARWAHAIAAGGLGTIYDQDLVYPALVPWMWAILALVQPVLQSSGDPANPAVLVAIKLPGVVADIGLALAVGYALRARPGWALAATTALLLHPALIHISAWWGQFDSVYALAAVLAWLLLAAGRPSWAAVALAAMLMTKPQAVVLLVPFAAWYLGHERPGRLVRPLAAGLLTLLVLWGPFLAADGPRAWLATLAANQDGAFGVLSLRAWNPWWLLQLVAANGDFAVDGGRVAGLLTFRQIGLLLAILFEVPVFLAVLRSPTPRTLAWGVATAQLVALMTLTTMHERYAFVAVAILPLAFPDRRAVALWAALSVTFTLNVLAAVPPNAELGALLPVDGPLGILGAGAMSLMTITALVVLVRGVDRAVGRTARRPLADAPARNG